ncbi:cation diffusion facilitator family transporter [Actinocorallia aurea]
MGSERLGRLLWLSVAAAVATIALKTTAWWLTGSVGLLSDAAESVVNLVAALIAVGALRWSSMPADDEHAYGHTKAEYFSAGAEGIMIFIASVTIVIAAVSRLLSPQPVEDVGAGLAVSAVASLINLAVGWVLVRAGRANRSIVVEADGRHLLTDVWTSVGVIAGVAVVGLTGWQALDPLIALAVAANIAFTGAKLVRRSGSGLMDRALPDDELGLIDGALRPFRDEGIVFHALRTRQAASRSFVSLHVLVPGSWTVFHGHRTASDVETAIRAALPHASVFTHLEAIEDPLSYQDTGLDPDPEAPLHTAPPTITDPPA